MSDRPRRPGDPVPIKVSDKRGGSGGVPGGTGGVPPSGGRSERQPPEVDKKLEELERRFDEATALAEERLDQLLRLKADFENYRKRMLRDQTDLVERASLRIVEQLLPVLDDLDRALGAARSAGEASEGLVRGVELVSKQLHDVLASEGLERVEAQGAEFDPHEHEAVASVPGDVPHATVLEVVRPGYRLKGKTVRPALVHVTVPHEAEGDRGNSSAPGVRGSSPRDGGVRSPEVDAAREED